ncbi:MAG: aspartate--tRNA ligase [Patescibacteria group bacterium]|nr:aspartate--tRNA ligase [Patescibacteria group bacterium]MDE1941082.1 aspartate--tRNA ligase [Patescibacteria group bacterium]MDE1967218.1 aspartate--tRNA ligase [Patescibacteria group bacterium]
MKRTYIKDLHEAVGKEASISGWVDVRRDHGKLIFIDFRDMTGRIQSVALPNNKEAHEAASKVRSEWVVRATGVVNKRPEKMVSMKNKETGEPEPNGDIELELKKLEILNEAETPPISVGTDGKDIGEESRLKFRYVDLRRPRMQKNIRMRGKTIKFIRDFLDREGFTEIETPILTKSTPEGARDYVVPSRLEHGHFYALPQSPQQYKQLLMVSGFEKYFQIARCFRDEDTRSDRQPEFTQMDLEMSFVDREDVMALNERLLIEIVSKLFPEKKIQEVPFPRISYAEAMAKYGSDRPDIRKDKDDPNLLAFCWVVDFPFFEKTDDDPLTGHKGWTFTHNPFSAPKAEDMEKLMAKKDIGDILATQYDVVLNGFEIGGGSIRNHEPAALKKVFEIMGYEEDRIDANFGHMLKALASGTPPHGGIAWGLDRLVTLLLGESSIREVIAFAKTGEGKDLMMEAPSEITKKQMRELGIEVKKKK